MQTAAILVLMHERRQDDTKSVSQSLVLELTIIWISLLRQKRYCYELNIEHSKFLALICEGCFFHISMYNSFDNNN